MFTPFGTAPSNAFVQQKNANPFGMTAATTFGQQGTNPFAKPTTSAPPTASPFSFANASDPAAGKCSFGNATAGLPFGAATAAATPPPAKSQPTPPFTFDPKPASTFGTGCFGPTAPANTASRPVVEPSRGGAVQWWTANKPTAAKTSPFSTPFTFDTKSAPTAPAFKPSTTPPPPAPAFNPFTTPPPPAPAFTPAATPLVVDGVVANPSPDAAELAERRAQAHMFSGPVLRDAYAILLNPDAPHEALPPPPPAATATAAATAASTLPSTACTAAPFSLATSAPALSPPAPAIPSSRFAVALVGKSSGGGAGATAIDTFAFVERSTLKASPLPAGWTLLDDATLTAALDALGTPEPNPLAALRAFEALVANKAATSWTDAQAKSLSVEFLVCFGIELTPRFDVYHRIRSTVLTDAERTTLTTAPFDRYVDQTVIARYQRPCSACSAAAPPPPLLALPPPPLVLATNSSTTPPVPPDTTLAPLAPASPRFSFALPAPPPPPAPPNTRGLIFSRVA